MAIRAASTESAVIHIEPIQTETIMLAILGETPLIVNRLAEKARQELLLPRGRKTAAERAASLKHNPLEEFRAAAYLVEDPGAETLLGLPSAAFKKSMMGAALRIPGAKKTEIAQLVRVNGELTGIYGIPEAFTAIVRSSGMDRTPDVRTRCIVPEWAAVLSITYMVPVLTQTSIVNLLSAAGQVNGVGDWRIEKGSGAYGGFRVVEPSNARFQRILAEGTRLPQAEAMEHPRAYGNETRELMSWFDTEIAARGRKVA